MLPKERRLLKSSDFDHVFNAGRAVNRPKLRILWAGGSGRAAVVASKAVGSVAYRNRVRRRWREALGRLGQSLPNGLDLVFVIKAEGAEVRGPDVEFELKEALTELPS